jgi:hypothetical protein
MPFQLICAIWLALLLVSSVLITTKPLPIELKLPDLEEELLSKEEHELAMPVPKNRSSVMTTRKGESQVNFWSKLCRRQNIYLCIMMLMASIGIRNANMELEYYAHWAVLAGVMGRLIFGLGYFCFGFKVLFTFTSQYIFLLIVQAITLFVCSILWKESQIFVVYVSLCMFFLSSQEVFFISLTGNHYGENHGGIIFGFLFSGQAIATIANLLVLNIPQLFIQFKLLIFGAITLLALLMAWGYNDVEHNRPRVQRLTEREVNCVI